MTERPTLHDTHIRESVAVELELRTLELGALLESVIGGLSTRERRRVRCECRQTVMIRGDEARLRFAMTNLVAMVLASSAASSVVAIAASQHARRAMISVRAVFRSLEQLWTAFDMVREIANAHGGSAAIATLEEAVRICIELPAAKRAFRNWPRRVHVLLVDDSVQQVVALAEVLSQDGLDIDYVTSGGDALARIAARPPDMLVIDAQLPDVHAIEVIRRARERDAALPVALLTGYPVEHPVVAHALASTGSAYLGKPVDVDALFDLIANAVH
jgi:CheY-like chemotaxis protein